jgi:hypothetical protein
MRPLAVRRCHCAGFRLACRASNAFVVRFSRSGTHTFSTYLGALSSAGASVTVERNGSIIATGTTGRELPLVRPLQPTYGGATDAFVSRITRRR